MQREHAKMFALHSTFPDRYMQRAHVMRLLCTAGAERRCAGSKPFALLLLLFQPCLDDACKSACFFSGTLSSDYPTHFRSGRESRRLIDQT